MDRRPLVERRRLRAPFLPGQHRAAGRPHVDRGGAGRDRPARARCAATGSWPRAGRRRRSAPRSPGRRRREPAVLDGQPKPRRPAAAPRPAADGQGVGRLAPRNSPGAEARAGARRWRRATPASARVAGRPGRATRPSRVHEQRPPSPSPTTATGVRSVTSTATAPSMPRCSADLVAPRERRRPLGPAAARSTSIELVARGRCRRRPTHGVGAACARRR